MQSILQTFLLASKQIHDSISLLTSRNLILCMREKSNYNHHCTDWEAT